MNSQGNRMVHQRLVTDFANIERRPGYDAVNNPLRLAVAELTPIGVMWQSAGVRHVVRNESGVIGRVLGDAGGVAIVEAPFEASGNRAYLVDADGSLRGNLPAVVGVERLMFYDVIESLDGAVAFLAAACGKDVRLEVREADGVVKQVVNIR
ncbi:hypothetical protein G3N57_02860 [Paraburkholderia sp. Se-20369]|nr:hypothetical protein [Paraburkholderia sp. Se-20369]